MIQDKDSVRTARTAGARMDIEAHGYHPVIDVMRYTAVLKCVVCGEPVAIVGEASNVEVGIDEQGIDYGLYLQPTFLDPAPPMILVPTGCAEDVTAALREAFAVYWSYPASAANSIRISIERLLDHLSIPAEVRGKNGQPSTLPLHARLRIYAQAEPVIAEHLLAAKWVGNYGSHGNHVTHDQVLDILEIVERALHDIYPADHSRIAEMAARIVAAKGPV